MVFAMCFGVNTPTEASSGPLRDVAECGVGKVPSTGFFQPAAANNTVRKAVSLSAISDLSSGQGQRNPSVSSGTV